jgi:hypothetical protein
MSSLQIELGLKDEKIIRDKFIVQRGGGQNSVKKVKRAGALFGGR